jgi:hypothetical protein
MFIFYNYTFIPNLKKDQKHISKQLIEIIPSWNRVQNKARYNIKNKTVL